MRKRRKWLAALMTIVMLVTMIPVGAFAQSAETVKPSLNISNSKTATNLVKDDDGNWQSDVTLSLPAADYQKEIDVVFVIDDTSAGSEIWTGATTKFLDELRNKENLDIKLGLVTFDAVSRDWLDVTTNGDLKGCVSISDDNNYSAIVDALETPLSGSSEGKAKKLGGSNTEWAVDYATEMLDYEGHSDDQYMIVFSDMFGYVYRGEFTVGENTYSDVPLSKINSDRKLGELCIANPMYNTWDSLKTNYKNSDKPEYDTFFRYVVDDDTTAWDAYWLNYQNIDLELTAEEALASATITPHGESYLTPFEKSTYLTYENIIDASDNGINVTVVNNSFNPGFAVTETIKNGMLNDLVENCYINLIRRDLPHGNGFDESMLPEIFDQLEDELIQVVGAGSYVIDEMGTDFDFVQDNTPTLMVEGTALTAAPISEEALNGAGATCGWTYSSESDPEKARFELYYYAEAGTFEGKTVNADSIVWKTKEDITKENIVSLQYTIQLTTPSEDPGTFGEYDKDGDGYLNSDDGTALETPATDEKGLATNAFATIYPIDSLGQEGDTANFPIPTVSYTVEEPIPEDTIRLQPADITIYTGGDGYESAVDGSDNTELGTTSDGLPEPGFYVTLPEELNNWMIKHADDEDKTTVEVTNEDGTTTQQTVVDLSDYLTFTYNDGQGNDRLWKLERYDKTNVSNSMAFSKYIYRILPAQVDGEEIPIRLQFTDQDGDITTSDDFTINLDGLYQEYDMTIYPGALAQQDVKAVLTVGEDVSTNKTEVVPGELVVRGVVSNAEDPTTEITDTKPTKQVEDVTAQVPDGTIYKINESDLAVENQDAVRLLVDSVVPDSNNTLQNEAVDKFEEITPQHDCEMNYLDLVDTSNGNAWVTASKEVTVHWPIPDDATDDSEFYIVHYEGLDRNDNDALDAGDYTQALYSEDEGNLTVDRETGNITFTVDSFSPFALFYTAEENDNPSGPVIPSDPDDPDPDTPDLNTDDHYSYIVGYPEDYRTGEATDDESLWPVKPQGNITRAEVATIFYRLLTNDARDENWTTSNSFTDVSADSWYNTPVSTLSAMGLIEGYEDGSFRPDNPITRAEFAAIAGRFFTDNDAIYEPGTFSDIEGAEWFADAVQAAKDHDIIGGYPDGSFKPNNPITRAEACSIVNRTTKRVPDADHLLALDEMRNWPDNADTSAWYYADMQEATNGHYYDYVLDENDEIVREEWTSERAPIDWEQVEEELEASH